MEPHRKRRVAGAALVALVLALPLTSSALRERLAGAWRGFSDPSQSAPHSRSDAPSDISDQRTTLEGSELRGDFEVVDLVSEPRAVLDGVLPSLSDLPIALTRRTLRYVAYYGTDDKGRETLAARLKRSERYREHIERALRDADVPEDLLFLAAIESGFNPQANSPKGAAGLFQLMPDTAERFGLSVGKERDERRSIPRSTEAALQYLKFLHERFGEWDLALAAYNCGEGRMDKAIAEARDKLGRAKDSAVAFHELAELHLLPSETRDFVPHIHAFAIVFHNRDLLGFSDQIKDAPLPFAEIAVPPRTKLSTIAKAAGISLATFRDYNPDLLADRVPNGRGDALVSVPSEELPRTLAALPAFIARDESEAPPAKRDGKGRSSASSSGQKNSPGPKLANSSGARTKAESLPEPPPTGPEEPAPKSLLERRGLAPAPGKPGYFVLESGILVHIESDAQSEVTIGATVTLLDPLKNRAAFGDVLSLEPRSAPRAVLRGALDKTATELNALVFDKAAPTLRTHLAQKRAKLFEKTGFGGAFESLGSHMFPKGHPLFGIELVGPTEPADDMFLEPEPTWALETVVSLKGPIEVEAVASDVAAAFKKTFEPSKLAPLPAAGHVGLGPNDKHLLVGWASAPVKGDDDTAQALAFVLACHNKLGRLHRALRHERTIATYVNCALETTPQGSVAWVLASPSLPYATGDADQRIDKAVDALASDGPTDSELTAAKGLLRSELARELSSATLRGLPKSRVLARNEALLARLGGIGHDEVVAAAKKLFNKKRRFSVTSGG